ncbi:MAG TPA: DUF3368 domain-containing protein [Leucothrix mucor]|nr:DUF3368 domain-containing protein [Leucothrix mucor]
MIISDSTTLIILFDLDKIELLSNLFTKIIIPQTVYQEISFKGSVDLGDFIEIKQAKPCELLETLNMMLDKGESEAIALAVEMKLKLIIDEKKGRKIAMTQGLKVIGLLGIVYLNVLKGFLSKDQAKAFIDSAIEQGYRINQKLVDDVFRQLETD